MKEYTFYTLKEYTNISKKCPALHQGCGGMWSPIQQAPVYGRTKEKAQPPRVGWSWLLGSAAATNLCRWRAQEQKTSSFLDVQVPLETAYPRTQG